MRFLSTVAMDHGQRNEYFKANAMRLIVGQGQEACQERNRYCWIVGREITNKRLVILRDLLNCHEKSRPIAWIRP